MDQYTHNFRFDLGNGQFIRGEAEFNTDGKASFKPEEWSQPFDLDTLKEFYKLMKYVKKIYETNSGIKKIVIKEKE